MAYNSTQSEMIEEFQRMGTMINDNINNNCVQNDSLLITNVRHQQSNIINTSNFYKNNKQNQQKLNNNKKDDHQTNLNPCSNPCKLRYQKIQEQINQINIKLQKIEINLNLSFTKHMQTTNINTKQSKTIEDLKYNQWVLQTKHKQIQQKSNNHLYLLQSKNANLQLHLNKLKPNKVCQQQLGTSNATLNYLIKNLQQKICRQREEQEHKLSRVVQTVKEMGNLQRKMILELNTVRQSQNQKQNQVTNTSQTNINCQNNNNSIILKPIQNNRCHCPSHMNFSHNQHSQNLINSVTKQCTKLMKK